MTGNIRQSTDDLPRAARSLLGVTLASVTVTLAALAAATSWPRTPGEGFWFWVVACLAGELLWVRLPLGRATLSMASACNFAALLLLPRGEAMLAAAAASLAAELLVMRKPPVRFLFNAGQTVLAVGAGGLVYHTLAGPGMLHATAISTSGLLPLGLAALAYACVNTGSVSLAVGLTERVAPWRAWWANFGSLYELLSTWALFSLGALLAVLYSLAGPLGTAFVSLPLLLAHDSYRRYLERRDGAAEAGTERRAA
ncbi:MAG TPA: hypothetical protein VI504_01625 [Candidatus Eisenbacteria bacterium]